MKRNGLIGKVRGSQQSIKLRWEGRPIEFCCLGRRKVIGLARQELQGPDVRSNERRVLESLGSPAQFENSRYFRGNIDNFRMELASQELRRPDVVT